MTATQSLPLTYRAPQWMRDARCREIGTAMYFPDPTQDPWEQWRLDRAVQRVCIFSCPVRAQCLAWALANDLDHGIFGGYTARQRQRHQAGERVYIALQPEVRRRRTRPKAAVA